MTQRKLERFYIREKSGDANVKGPLGRYTDTFYVITNRLFWVHSHKSVPILVEKALFTSVYFHCDFNKFIPCGPREKVIRRNSIAGRQMYRQDAII